MPPTTGHHVAVQDRHAAKQDRIVEELRESIRSRRFPAGSRMPTRAELQKDYGVSSVTVQRALDRLIADGFVVPRGRHGTFVVERPPHTCTYGLVIPRLQGEDGWVRFWTALGNEAMAMTRQGDVSVVRYHGIDGHHDGDDWRRLLHDLEAQRLAGLLFSTVPAHGLAGTAVMTADIPRIAITLRPEPHPFTPLMLDTVSFVDRALEHLHNLGRTRIAMLGVPGHPPGFHRRFADGLRDFGMSTRPFWFQQVTPSTPEPARNLAHLLLHPGQRDRPDALIITDDNLVEHAAAGVIAAGVHVPDDCALVAHCNFPWPTPSVLPARRLGYNAREVWNTAIAAIDRLRRGESVGQNELVVKARFEDEL
jgi:DNA-binding LacI/PurR family transcriptional regulator